MSNTGLKKFSEELKKQREEKEISLQQISSKTKIDLKFLKAIEENNFEIMPEVYMRAFIREYANTIGLDGPAMLVKYDKYKSGQADYTESTRQDGDETVTVDDADESIKEFDSTSSASRSDLSGKGMGKNQIIYLSAAALAVVAIIVIYFVYNNSSRPEFITERRTETPAEVNETPAERFIEKEPETKSVPENTSASNASKEVNVKVTASDTSWIRVLIDDRTVDEFMLYPNGAKDLIAKDNMKFLLGNSGGVQFWLNGENLNFQGKKGVIRNVKIDKNGLSNISASGKTKNDSAN